ncbi:hypothetical protein BIV17_01565 [Streptococcus agalactiae]|nr:hypothetical protein BIV17_01565 [Streptococcus agalactiae]OHX79631.1 hypothetical protein BIV15_03680 [Streptococcus agalactiae]OHX81646.1 hypothetical protein BIV12_00025 [Streptococcus agalactiae]
MGITIYALLLINHAYCQYCYDCYEKKTDTLDVDIFDIWHLSITGLLIMWYAKQMKRRNAEYAANQK